MRTSRITSFLLVAIIVIATQGLSEAALPDQLRALNVSLYSAPCPANDMTLKDLSGRQITLSSLRGKVVLLNFWKIECPPCSMEKPILERIFRRYAGRGLEIVAVNLVDDASQQQAYCRAHGFTFKFTFDPDNLLSLRQQVLGSGAATSFLVNSRQEAIYEIPGVPTTYVIDRSGKIVGNAVGMVNWEQPVLTHFLESLLGPPASTLAQHPEQTTNSTTSARGSDIGFVKPAAASGATTAKDMGLQKPPAAANTNVVAAPLPAAQNPTVMAQMMPQAPEPVPEPQKSPSLIQVRPAAPPKAAGPKKKPEPIRETATGKPARGTKPVGVTSGTMARPVAQPAPGAPTPPGTKPMAIPPQPVSPVAPSSPSAAAAPALPALPPALPYTPSRMVGSQPNTVPDAEGNVWARVPGQAPSAQLPGSPGLPSAQPLTSGNPITGFVLDSFGGSRRVPIPQQPVGEQQPPAPASSFLGQLGQDFQQLGAGIRDAVSRIAPSR
jgi:peroxiredoxin